MPSSIIAGPGTVMGPMYGDFQGCLLPGEEDNTDLWTSSYPNGNRGTKTCEGYESNTVQGGFWPSSSGLIAPAAGILGPTPSMGVGAAGQWEPFSTGRGGGHQQKYFMGFVLSSTGQPIAGATVTAFITATNVFAGQTTSQPDGFYECPSPYGTGLTHYLIAQQGSAPSAVAGATVNTLVPTNRDGT